MYSRASLIVVYKSYLIQRNFLSQLTYVYANHIIARFFLILLAAALKTYSFESRNFGNRYYYYYITNHTTYFIENL